MGYAEQDTISFSRQLDRSWMARSVRVGVGVAGVMASQERLFDMISLIASLLRARCSSP